MGNNKPEKRILKANCLIAEVTNDLSSQKLLNGFKRIVNVTVFGLTNRETLEENGEWFV